MPQHDVLTLHSTSPRQTTDVARRLARCLGGGDVVLLHGPLGAGKTWFVKGLAEGLGVAEGRQVKSPSFVLMNVYPGRVKVVHIDAYRLECAEDLLDLGSVEFLHEPATVTAVEWAERVAEAIDEPYVEVTLGHEGPRRRSIRITWTGPEPRRFDLDAAATDEPLAE